MTTFLDAVLGQLDADQDLGLDHLVDMELLRHDEIIDGRRVFLWISVGTCHTVGERVLHLTDVADELGLTLEHESRVQERVAPGTPDQRVLCVVDQRNSLFT